MMMDMREPKRALELLEQSASRFEEAYGEGCVEQATPLSGIGCVYIQQGEYNDALTLLEQALSLYETKNGKDCKESADTLNYMGVVFFLQKDYSKAIELYTKSLQIQEIAMNDSALKFEERRNLSRKYANIVHNMADVMKAQHQYDEALSRYNVALQIKESLYGIDHIDAADVVCSIAELHQEKRDYVNAHAYFERAASSYEDVYGTDGHPKGSMARLSIARIKTSGSSKSSAQKIARSAFAKPRSRGQRISVSQSCPRDAFAVTVKFAEMGENVSTIEFADGTEPDTESSEEEDDYSNNGSSNSTCHAVVAELQKFDTGETGLLPFELVKSMLLTICGLPLDDYIDALLLHVGTVSGGLVDYRTLIAFLFRPPPARPDLFREVSMDEMYAADNEEEPSKVQASLIRALHVNANLF